MKVPFASPYFQFLVEIFFKKFSRFFPHKQVLKNRVQINPTDGGSGADNTKVKNCGCQWNLKLGAQKVVKKSTKTSGEKVETTVQEKQQHIGEHGLKSSEKTFQSWHKVM